MENPEPKDGAFTRIRSKGLDATLVAQNALITPPAGSEFEQRHPIIAAHFVGVFDVSKIQEVA
jgi:hypothetical protein